MNISRLWLKKINLGYELRALDAMKKLKVIDYMK